MMTRRDVAVVTTACASLLLSAAAARAQTGNPCATSKIAIIRGQMILSSMPEYLRADSLLTKTEEGYRLELAKQQATIDSAASAFRDKSPMLNSVDRAVQAKKIDDQYTALQQHANELRDKAAQDRQQKLGPIETRVQGVIDGMRAEYNCAVIFDANAQGAGIISIDLSIDVTQRVIDRLKAGGDAAPPPATKKP